MKCFHKVLSTILLVCMICAIIVPNAMATEENNVQAKLNSVLDDFPVDSYFTTDGQRGSPGDLLSILRARGLSTRGFDQSQTCVGFAKYVWAKIFGHNITAPYRVKIDYGGASDKDTWSNAKPGDLIYFNSKTSKPDSCEHAAIVWSVSSADVTILDCNYGNTNQISVYTATFGSKSNWARTYCSIYRANNYDEIGGVITNTHIITFDPNGGDVWPTSKTITAGTLLTAMPTPTRSGYTFLGWAMDKIDPDGKGVSSTVIVADGVWTFDKDTTLYAHWTKDKHTHTNGAYFYSDNHPHYKFYTCTTCGEVYTDGSTTNMSSCSICNPSSNDFPLFSDGVYTLAPLCALGSRLDVARADWRDNANVQIHESNGTLAQQWELTYVGDGYYQLVCKASGKALDVSQAGTEPGTNVQQFEPNGTIAQQWRIDTAADGSYFLIPRVNTNLRLDVSGAGNTNGTNVQIYTANGTAAQMWEFYFVDSSPTSNSGSSVSVPQYFSCNVGIFTVKGKTVNLYNNPGDSKRVDYFDLGQAVGSSYGVNMPDGTTWYQVSVTSKGNVITVWLKYESDKMTIRNL